MEGFLFQLSFSLNNKLVGEEMTCTLASWPTLEWGTLSRCKVSYTYKLTSLPVVLCHYRTNLDQSSSFVMVTLWLAQKVFEHHPSKHLEEVDSQYATLEYRMACVVILQVVIFLLCVLASSPLMMVSAHITNSLNQETFAESLQKYISAFTPEWLPQENAHFIKISRSRALNGITVKN